VATATKPQPAARFQPNLSTSAAPLHLLAGLLSAQGLGWREKLAAARWAQSLLHGPDVAEHLTVCQLTHSQPEKLNRLLWHPLCVSALNTPPRTASARVFRNVIRAAFGGRNPHSDLLLPRRDLTALFPAPAAARITELGGSVRLSSRVTTLAAAADDISVSTRDETTAYSHTILAVAPQHLADLAAPVPELQSLTSDIASYTYQAIATAYMQFDPTFRLEKPLFALAEVPHNLFSTVDKAMDKRVCWHSSPVLRQTCQPTGWIRPKPSCSELSTPA